MDGRTDGRTRYAVGYVRVAPGELRDPVRGIVAQRRAIEAWVRDQGLELAELLHDECSLVAPLADRPRGARLHNLARGRAAHGYVVVVARLDSLWSSAARADDGLSLWTDAGARVVALDVGLDTEGGDAVLATIHALRVAQAEAKLARLAVPGIGKAGKLAPSQIPFGFRALEDGHVVADERQQATVGRVIELRDEGLSMQRIADQLNVEGRLTKHGHAWKAPTVARVLKRAAKPGRREQALRYLADEREGRIAV